MRYIKEFANANEIQTAIDSGILGKPYVAYVENEDKIDWNTKEPTPHDYSQDYLTFDIISSGVVNWVTTTNSMSRTIEYNLNGNGWNSITSNTEGVQINVVAGDKIQFKGDNSYYGTSTHRNSFNGTTCSYNVYGNIMSLINSTNFSGLTSLTNNYIFYGLFANTQVISAENLILPATTLKNGCYYYMFGNCSNLTTTPELPATTLADSCYEEMFTYCISLTTAPELPATKLESGCYMKMFTKCSALNYIKCLANNISAWNCTNNWVQFGVSETGTFVKKAGVDWPSGESGIPSGWTVIEEP